MTTCRSSAATTAACTPRIALHPAALAPGKRSGEETAVTTSPAARAPPHLPHAYPAVPVCVLHALTQSPCCCLPTHGHAAPSIADAPAGRRPRPEYSEIPKRGSGFRAAFVQLTYTQLRALQEFQEVRSLALQNKSDVEHRVGHGVQRGVRLRVEIRGC